jgi:beta-phosphoglucomutase
MVKACIFDLDGVIVDTAKYHYLAWKRLAHILGVDFTEEENENLKGVSRVESLAYILKLGNVTCTDTEKIKYAQSKNEWYLDYISNLKKDEILPGVETLLKDLKKHNIKIALGSASKNAIPLLESTELLSYFDFISDGNSTDKSKPDPEVFYIAAKGLDLSPAECVVLEDSIKGIEAAVAGGFYSIGIGDADTLAIADVVFPNLEHSSWKSISAAFQS